MTIVLGLRTVTVLRWWSTADWLINYQGGFVRRGLIGELLFRAHGVTGVGLLTLLSALLVVLQLIVFGCFATQVERSSLSTWILALAISPASLAYPVLDSLGGFHKEMLPLACFFIMLSWRRLRNVSEYWMAVMLSGVAVVSILAHEVALFYLPYFVLALLTMSWPRPKVLRAIAVPSLLAGAAFAVSCVWHGTTATAQRICASLGYPNGNPKLHDFCSGEGAIEYLGASTHDGIRNAWISLRLTHAPYHYLLLALPCAIPLLFGLSQLSRGPARDQVRRAGIGIAFCILCKLPLFVIAVDWGRWIHLHLMYAAGILLMLDRRNLLSKDQGKPVVAQVSVLTLGLLGAYALTWSLPGFYDGDRHNYLDAARQAAAFCHIRFHSGRQPRVAIGSITP